MYGYLIIFCSGLVLPTISHNYQDYRFYKEKEHYEIAEYVIHNAGPAVWGAKAPDYSLAEVKDGTSVFLRGLIFVDNKTTAHYQHDMYQVKENIMKMVDEANQFLNQLGVGLVIVGILQTNRADLSLQSFQEYHQTRLLKLPEHEFATLIAYKYGGGLAYVDGMCSSHAVSLSGFYPMEPRAMGSIFFHEIAHLVGVPHKPINQSLYVPNCRCTPKESKREGGCLRIPGFDHDCTAQQFVNVVYKNKCLPPHLKEFDSSEPVCGNGVIEVGEDCDCGLPGRCSDLNCRPHTCVYNIHPYCLLLILLAFILFFVALTWIAVRRYTPVMLNCFKTFKARHDRNTSPYQNGQIQTLASSPYQNRKMSHSSTTGSSTLLVDKRFATIKRPAVPPPPPPKTTIQVMNTGTNGQVNTRVVDYSESLYGDFSDEDDFSDPGTEGPTSYPLPTGVPTCPSYPPYVPINRVTVDLQSPRTNANSTATTSSTTNTTSLSF